MTTVFLGLGSNINPVAHLEQALEYLQQHFFVKHISPWYQSAARGFVGADFINLVVEIDCDCGLEELAQRLRAIEFTCGRPQNAQKYRSRTIDIDILLFGDYVGSWSGGQLPRGDVALYAYVLKPLLDIAPSLLDPATGSAWQAHWEKISSQSLKLVRTQ